MEERSETMARNFQAKDSYLPRECAVRRYATTFLGLWMSSPFPRASARQPPFHFLFLFLTRLYYQQEEVQSLSAGFLFYIYLHLLVSFSCLDIIFTSK